MLASMKPEYIVIIPKNILFGCCIVNLCLQKFYIFFRQHISRTNNNILNATLFIQKSIPDFDFKYERTYLKFIDWKQTETITVNCWKQIKINCNILIAFMAILTHQCKWLSRDKQSKTIQKTQRAKEEGGLLE